MPHCCMGKMCEQQGNKDANSGTIRKTWVGDIHLCTVVSHGCALDQTIFCCYANDRSILRLGMLKRLLICLHYVQFNLHVASTIYDTKVPCNNQQVEILLSLPEQGLPLSLGLVFMIYFLYFICRLDPPAALDFLWACTRIPRIWQGRDQRTPQVGLQISWHSGTTSC